MNNNKLAIDDMAARWGFRVGQEEPVSCTILVSGVDIHNVTVISEALEVAEDVEVDEVTRIGDGQVLIDYTANSDRDVGDIKHVCVKGIQYPVVGEWPHDSRQSTVVCVRGLPPSVTEDTLESYMEGRGIDVQNIVLSRAEGTANIELVNHRDVPRVIYAKHHIKKQAVEFVEASVAPMEVEDVVDASFIDQQNLYTFNEPHALKVVCAGPLQKQSDLFKESLVYQFALTPYFLTVNKYTLMDDGAYLTFNEGDGVEKVMSQPLMDLLGAEIELSAIPLREVEFSPEPGPDCLSVLLVENLPASLPGDMIEGNLKYLFKNRGYETTDCKIDKKCAYFVFSDQKAVSDLIASPPDQSTLCGCPVRYTRAKDVDFPTPGPCVLVVDGLPTQFSGVTRALTLYLTNVAKEAPVSCVVDGKQAIVKFKDDQVAKQLVHTPPTLPFFEKSLTFSTRPDSSSQSRTEDYDSSISSKTRVHHSKAGWPHSNTSPPRSKAQHWPNSNTSPPRSKAQHWPDSNTSPPRSKAQHWPDSNTSPPHSNAQHWPDSNTNNPDSNTNRPDDNTSPLNYKAQHWPESNTNGPDSNTNSPHSNTNRPDDNTHFNRSQRTYSESHVSRGPMLTQLLDNNVSESLPSTTESSRPTPAPRVKRPRSASLVIERIPPGYSSQQIKLFIECLTKKDCNHVQLKSPTALVELTEPIVVDTLQSSLAEEKLDGHLLTVKPLGPSCSVLISSKEKLNSLNVKFFCKRYCNDGGNPEVSQKSDNEFIVTFSSQQDLKQFKDANHQNKIGSTVISVSDYHPILADLEEADGSSSDDEEPPPQNFCPSSPNLYQHPAYSLEMSDAESKFMMQRLTRMKEDLIHLHGDPNIVGNTLKVRPLHLAKEISDWKQQVQRIVNQHKTDLQFATIPSSEVSRAAVMEYLHQHRINNRDFEFALEKDGYKISGGPDSVNKAMDHIDKMVEEEVEVTRELRRPPHLIEYFLKFSQDEINSIQPPVKITRSPDNPDLVIACGVKRSLDKIEAIAHEKLSHLKADFVHLTRKAHQLLASPAGKKKLKEHLKIKSLDYIFEKLDLASGEYTHQVCITSSDHSHLVLSKRIFENLCKEEKIDLPSDKHDMTTTTEWEKLVERLSKELFASVRTTADTITITGDENDIRKFAAEIRTFLDKQDDATDEFLMSKPVWEVIKIYLKSKLESVKKEAKRDKVQLTFPTENDATVYIHLEGNRRHFEDVKVKLGHLVEEVQTKDFSLPPKAGLHRLKKPTLTAKCDELQRVNQVIIRHEIEQESAIGASSVHGYQNELNVFHRIINATSPCGVRVNVCVGNFARQRCDAIVTFIPESPRFMEPVLVALSNAGGQDVHDDLETSLGSQRLISASLHRTQQTGNLKCKGIFHAVLPPASSMPGSDFRQQRSALSKILQEAFEELSQNYSTIVLSPLSVPPLSYPSDLYAQCLISTVAAINNGMYSADLSIQVFIDNESEVDDFKRAMKDKGFHIIYNRTAVQKDASSLLYRPTVTKQHGTPDTLEKVVKITSGDMLDMQVDVYINSTNPEMNFSNGVLSSQFKKRCGKKLMDEVDAYLKQVKTLKYGKVAVTSAEGLKAKSIYHIALKRLDEPGYERSFRESIENILITAKDYGHKSIAIPCLGVVGLGYKPEFSARVLFEAVISFHYKYPDAITHFHFIVRRHADEKAFYEEYNAKVMQFTKVSAPTPRDEGNGSASFKIEIVHGDLAQEKTEVIVNSTSVDIREDANQISKAIFRASGNDMLNACVGLVSSGLRLTDGMVVPTSASGELRCDKVYHAHIPGKFQRDHSPTQAEGELFKTVIYGCLEIAEETRQESIAFPAFCLGIGNYTVEQSGGLMFEAFNEFTAKMAPKCLKEVRIVIHKKDLYEEFRLFYNQGNGFGKLKKGGANGVTPSSVMPHPAEPKPRSLTNAQMAPSSRKGTISFHLYGIQRASLSNAEKDLKAFINEIIVTDMVELGDTIKLFHQDDMEKFLDLATKNDVDIDIQHDLERIIVSGEDSAVEKLIDKVQHKKFELQVLTSELQLYEWYTENDAGVPECYSQDIMMQLEIAYKRHFLSINVTIDQVHVIIDLTKMEEHDGVGGLRRKIVRKRKALQLELPPEWCPQPCDSQGIPKIVYFETIQKHDPEYARATRRFLDTLDNVPCTIESVKRVQNPGEYARYQSLKSSWESIHGRGVIKEKELFHGTKEESVNLICAQGFNRIFAADNNAAFFGKGVYFALESSYSVNDKYASKDKKGHRHMLVCTLLVGKYIKGAKSMKTAPALPDNPQVLYDTLVNRDDSPTIFVAMKDSQAYPKYWITFTKDN